MADSSVVIGVTADTKQADKEFDKLKKKMEQTSSNIKSKMGGASSGASSNAQGGGASNDNNNTLQMPSNIDDPNNWGKTAGKLFTAEFITRMAKQGVDVIKLAMTDPSTGNDDAETFASAANGGIEGAVAGGLIGGPWGAVIGGLYGALMGGVIAETKHLHRIIDEFNQEELKMDAGRIGVHTSVGKSASQQAESMMTIEERRNFYKQQYDDLQAGENGILQLTNKITRLRLDGEQDSQVYKQLEQIRDAKLALANEYEIKFAQESMRFNFRKYEADDLTDSYAKMGIEIGNQVNVEDLQQRQLDAMQQMKEYLKKIAENMTEMSKVGIGYESINSSFFI